MMKCDEAICAPVASCRLELVVRRPLIGKG